MSSPISQQPLISVVVPSYNHRSFLPATLASVLGQSYRNIELIVIDDGSTDGSPAYLEERARSEPRMRVVCRENRGAHVTINEGIASAQGELVAILNSDDEFHPRRLERMLDVAREHGHPFFGFSAVDIVDTHGQPSLDSNPGKYYQLLLSMYAGKPTPAFFWVGNLAITTSNFFFSRSLFEHVGPFVGLRYMHDWDWALRAQKVAQVVRVNEPLVRYRVHGTNTISEHNPWKHVAENAYVFTQALRDEGLVKMARLASIEPFQALQILLENKSFLPLPVLTLLAMSDSEQALREKLESGALEALLPTLLGPAARDVDLMKSVDHLRKKFAQADAERLSTGALWREIKKRGARLRRRVRQRFAKR